MIKFPGRAITQVRQSPAIVQALIIQQFFEGFVPIMALYAIMFERIGGLSFNQIGVLFSIWSLAYLVSELPSGVLADYWSRRNVIILGGLLRSLGFAAWLLWPNFWGYAVGFGLWGAMIACTSGAVTAYLHNELRAAGRPKKYAQCYGWIMAAHWMGTLAGYAIASVLTLRYTTLLIGLSLASSLLTAATLLYVGEAPYKKQDTYMRTMKAGLREVLHSPWLRYISYGMFSIYMIIGVLEELLPRLYAQLGLNDTGVSVVLAVALLLTVMVLTRLETFVQYSITKQLLTMAAGVLCLLAGLYIGHWGGVALLFLFSMVFQLFRPVFQHHVQEAVVGDERATIGSIPGLAAGLLGAGAYAVIGMTANSTGERAAIGIYGAVWLSVLLTLAYRGRHMRTIASQPSA